MAKTYNNLRALSVKQSKFGDNGHRIPVVTDDDEIVILYNENKIKKNDIVKSVQNGGIDFMDKVLCINKAMAEQLAVYKVILPEIPRGYFFLLFC